MCSRCTPRSLLCGVLSWMLSNVDPVLHSEGHKEQRYRLHMDSHLDMHGNSVLRILVLDCPSVFRHLKSQHSPSLFNISCWAFCTGSLVHNTLHIDHPGTSFHFHKRFPESVPGAEDCLYTQYQSKHHLRSDCTSQCSQIRKDYHRIIWILRSPKCLLEWAWSSISPTRLHLHWGNYTCSC